METFALGPVRYHSTMLFSRPFGAALRGIFPVLMAASLGGIPIVCADGLPDLGESARADFPPQLERKIGESIMNEIRLREPTYIDDDDVNDYLASIGARLVAASDDPGANLHFFAIRDRTVNAFAMFGGFVGINSGTVLTAQSESELAGVMAHEISHVTQHHLARQIAKEKQNSIATMIAMGVAILAARSNGDLAGAAVASAQAGAVQAQLAYSRDFEREADRVGYQMLEKAGFEVAGMAAFFERLQKAGRVYENNAPVYMRSHPVTVERISDMQNRAQKVPYRQLLDSLEFLLVRAKLTAQDGPASERAAEFARVLRERKFVAEAATRYGLVYALLRAKDSAGAEREMEALKRLKLVSPLLSRLAAEVRDAVGDSSAALKLYADAVKQFPQSRSLAYAYAEALYAGRRYEEAQRFLDLQQQTHSQDFRLYGLQAKIFSAQGKRLQQQRAQAEFYFLQGRLKQAVEQLQFAQQSTDGNFFEHSAVDARLRELRKQVIEEEKEKQKQR